LKIALLYNEDAGYSVKVDEIRTAIERRDHEVVHAIDKDDDGTKLLESGADLFVVAGGDGTVASAVRMIAGHPMPLAILPVGTANNIATSLGVGGGSLTELVGRWEAARRVPLDIGIVTGALGRRYFVEALGSGLVPTAIETIERRRIDEGGDPPDKVARAQETFRDVLDSLEPQPLVVTVDGTTLSGDFLLVEVLNIRSVGPNLVLCPDASPTDGFFSVVVAAETDREELGAYLRRVTEAGEARIRLPVHRARQVDIEGADNLHLDDRVTRSREIGPISAQVAAAALEVLV
jgi:diacylglycerol kinase family enzyme